MIYYDRQLPLPLLRLLEDDAVLGWLSAFAHTELGVAVRAHVQFRRNERDRKLGSIKIYFGRTSPLEIIGRARDQVSFWADDAYRGPSPVAELFHESVENKAIAYRRTRIEKHLKATAERVRPAFLDGEGRILNVEDMEPKTLDSHAAQGPARYAIETNVGWFAERRIKAGEKVTGLPKP